MQTLYLVRHTAPDIPPGTCYGQLDLGVAASFADEARQVHAWLPPVELIITSPLKRARQLADYLAERRGCELRTDARLMERHFGAWEGRPWSRIPRGQIDAWAADLLRHAPPAGESAEQVVQRVRALLRAIAGLPQRSIALSTHGGVMRAVLAEAAGLTFADTMGWELAYGAVVAVRYEAR